MIRHLCAAALCGVVGLLLVLQGSSDAQGKKDDPAKQILQLQKTIKEKDQLIQKLELQIQKFKLDDVKDEGKIAQLQQRIKQLESELKAKKTDKTEKGEKTPAQLKKELELANASLKDKDLLIATLRQNSSLANADLSRQVESLRKSVRDLESVKNAPLVHSKILKLKKGDDTQIKLINDEAMKTIAKIDGVRGLWIGKRAENGTPDLARTDYQLGMIVLFDDAESLQRFLDDPLHKQFNDKLANSWERPVIYDILREMK